ncbi:MAG: type II secretion system ATPase GspE [Candidatus Krumholzibacteria bacterium]|nr:type II secretion system ATPase GspE [Candidatus Krumholzibacteria bacterium]
MARKKKIGEILIDNNACTLEQLDECLRIQEESGAGRRIGEILIEKEYISENDLLSALSVQTGIPFANEIDEEMIDRQLLEQVPFTFARKNSMIPLNADNGIVTVAVADPLNMQPLDDIGLLLNKEVQAVICREEVISTAINRCYHQDSRAAEKIVEDMVEERREEVYHIEEETQDLLEMADKAPIIKLVNVIIFQAIKERASDIHIEVYEKELKIRYRIDGVLYTRLTPPKQYHASIVSRIKIMAKLNIAERRLPQDGKIAIKVNGNPVDLRVSVLPTMFGESVVMRVLDRSNVSLDLERLGLREDDLRLFRQLIRRPHGIVLVTGPTGSGKTTTLYSVMNELNDVAVKILTTEDPVEYDIDGLIQVQIHGDIGLTFARCLRHFLRQDPDIILVGEIRDLETAQMAFRASLTGHLVLSTLHTNDAPSAATRLVDIGMAPYIIGSSILGVLAQRLVRRICPHCREQYQPSSQELERLNLTEEQAAKIRFHVGRGCRHCRNTGYSGRVAVYELMKMNDELRGALGREEDVSALRRIAVKSGMKTLRYDALTKVHQGSTSAQEVINVMFAPELM